MRGRAAVRLAPVQAIPGHAPGAGPCGHSASARAGRGSRAVECRLGFCLPNSRALLPTLHTFCPDGFSFCPDGVSFFPDSRPNPFLYSAVTYPFRGYVRTQDTPTPSPKHPLSRPRPPSPHPQGPPAPPSPAAPPAPSQPFFLIFKAAGCSHKRFW